MIRRDHTTATMPFAPAVRIPPPAYPTADIVLPAPRALPDAGRTTSLVRLLPVVMAVATVGMMLAVLRSESGTGRHPMLLMFPVMMLLSAVISAVSGRDGRAGQLNDSRSEYLGLPERECGTTSIKQRQHNVRHCCGVTPSRSRYGRWSAATGCGNVRPQDPDFCQVRVGLASICRARQLSDSGISTGRPGDPSWRCRRSPEHTRRYPTHRWRSRWQRRRWSRSTATWQRSARCCARWSASWPCCTPRATS